MYICFTKTHHADCFASDKSFYESIRRTHAIRQEECFRAYVVSCHEYFCEVLCSKAAAAVSRNVTLDGWSAALGAPTSDIFRDLVGRQGRPKAIPFATLSLGAVPKTREELFCIVDGKVNGCKTGYGMIKIYTGTSDDETSVRLACDLLTSYVESVPCVVYTLALCVEKGFVNGTAWEKILCHIIKIISHFNFHSKAKVPGESS